MNLLLKLTAALLLLSSCSDNQPAARKPAPALAPLQKNADTIVQQGRNPYSPVDVSPMDIAYFPVDYPIAKMSNPKIDLPKARIIYSRPHKQGRSIFGALLKYGEPWRLGANEATEIELFQNATIQNKKVAKGRYILYNIPHESSWTVVFNSNVYSWGLKQDTAQDKYRFEVPIERAPSSIEFYTMTFQKTNAGADLLMAWDDVVARLPISF